MAMNENYSVEKNNVCLQNTYFCLPVTIHTRSYHVFIVLTIFDATQPLILFLPLRSCT